MLLLMGTLEMVAVGGCKSSPRVNRPPPTPRLWVSSPLGLIPRQFSVSRRVSRDDLLTLPESSSVLCPPTPRRRGSV